MRKKNKKAPPAKKTMKFVRMTMKTTGYKTTKAQYYMTPKKQRISLIGARRRIGVFGIVR